MRMLRNLFLSLLIATIFMTGCQPKTKAPSSNDDVAAIKAVINDLTDAYAAREWERFVSSFEQDAVWMPPASQALIGAVAWRAFVDPWWDSYAVTDIGVDTHSLIISGDWAIERHVDYQTVVPVEGGESAAIYFNGIWIFRRQQDGAWKIAQYIWNESPPLE